MPHSRTFGGLAAAVLAAPFVIAAAPPSYDFDFVTIGAPNNPAYDGSLGPGNEGRGSVPYEYRMARTEVTSAQWLEFVNLMAPQSGNPLLFGRPFSSGLRPAGLGSYQLNPFIANAASVPVLGIEWREAALFCNWLNNGKPQLWSEIQAGAYDASTFTSNPDGTFNDQATRSPGARYWIPSLDEWMKAAHYDPDRYGENEGGWWRYSHMSDQQPLSGSPGEGQTSAGYRTDELDELRIPLGAYTDVRSPWGLTDLSGGAHEWVEEVIMSNSRGVEGTYAGEQLPPQGFGIPTNDAVFVTSFQFIAFGGFAGLRVASAVPAPGGIVIAVPMLVASCRRRRHA